MQKQLDAVELARIINVAYDAVDKSALGPIFVYPDPGNVMNKQMNNVAWTTFTIVLNGMMVKMQEKEN